MAQLIISDIGSSNGFATRPLLLEYFVQGISTSLNQIISYSNLVPSCLAQNLVYTNTGLSVWEDWFLWRTKFDCVAKEIVNVWRLTSRYNTN